MAELFWRAFPAVRPRERGRFLFFGSLSFLLMLAQTLGMAGSEALYLSRVGVEHLPLAFVGASLLTVLGSLLYATGVHHARNDRYFVELLVGAAAALAATALASPRWDGALSLLFAGWYLTYSVFLNHYWTFTGDYFDTLAAKRLFPLFTVGASLGGFVGGALATALSGFAPPEALILGWAGGLAAAAALLLLSRRQLRLWGPLTLQEADETSVAGMQGAIRYMGRSALSRWLVLSALGMVLALFVAQYLYSQIFVRSFPSAEALATFLGIYLAVTNLVEVAIEVLVVPQLIQRAGVASANLVHPALTLASFLGLGLLPNLQTALGARVNRELLENALAGPVRNLIYNALPLRFRGRMRAFLEGIVVYSGMMGAGALLWLLAGRLPDAWLAAGGLCMAGLYLLANLKVRQEYLRALVHELKAGRLDLDELGDDLGDWEVHRLAALWEELLQHGPDHLSSRTLKLAHQLARAGVTEPLVRAASHPLPAVRVACLEALGSAPTSRALGALREGLADPSPEVCLAALGALARALPDLRGATEETRPGAEGTAGFDRLEGALRALLERPEPQLACRAASLLGGEGQRFLERALDPERSGALALSALACLGPDQLPLLLRGARADDPEVRGTALERLAQVARPVPLPPQELIRDLNPTASVPARRGALRALGTLDDPSARAAVASALADPSREIRRIAGEVLASQGRIGLAAAAPYLEVETAGTVEAALAALNSDPSPEVRELLLQALRRRVRGAWSHLLALEVMPAEGELSLRFLRAALQDAVLRARGLAFRILEVLEDPSVMRSVEKVLRFERARGRADALEVLSNLGDREAASLLVLMLEEGPVDEKLPMVTPFVAPPADLAQVLAEARQSRDRWIQAAVAGPEAWLGEAHAGEETMERLLILKRVPLFAQMSLEQLEAINQISNEVWFLSGEVIFREGDVGSQLYLLVEGQVKVVKDHGREGELVLARLEGVSYFGEMAILDDEPRSATIVVERDARLLSLEGDRLKELVLQMPEIAFEIFRVLTRRVRISDQRLQKLVQTSDSRGDGPTALPAVQAR